MNNQQKQANANYFKSVWGNVRQGGTWIWADKRHTYIKMPSGKMMCKSMDAWTDLRDITPKGWAKANCSLQRQRPTYDEVRNDPRFMSSTEALGGDDSVYHQCPKCNQTYITKHRTHELATASGDTTSMEQWCSGICGDECWYACSEAEIVQHKFLNPRYNPSAREVVLVSGGDGNTGVASY